MYKSSKMVKMGDLRAQHKQVRIGMMSAWRQLLFRSDFIAGQAVKNFESEFSSYTGSRNCIGVGNGTDALEIILQALDLPSSSYVVVPANSFVATAEAVANVGLRPRFVDVGEDFQISKSSLKSALDKDVSAIIVVHLYGYPNEVDWIADLIAGRDVKIVEDCAQAHGAKLAGKHVGTLGVAGAFSFYPGKNLGAIGDAGAIVTEDASLAEKCRRIANHGRLTKFDHNLRGRNSRLDTLQAAVLSTKLRKLDNWNHQRRKNAAIYRRELEELDQLTLPPQSTNYEVYHHFVVRTRMRDELKEFLASSGIETGIHYPNSIDELRPFQEFSGFASQARSDSKTILSLPVAEHLREKDIMQVTQNIKRFFSENDL